MCLRRGHNIVFIIGNNTHPALAIFNAPGYDCLYPVTGHDGFLSYIEPKFSLSVSLVETMAGETMVGQDWPDITIVTYFAFFGG